MSPRTEVATALSLGLEGFQVIPTIRALDGLNGPAVLVIRETVTNRTIHDDHALAVWVLDPHQDPTQAEDPLDGWLDAVLAVLDAHPNLVWSTAERSLYADTWQGYRITVTVSTSKE